MPIATPDVYAEMLRRAKESSYAFPAINCTSSETVNAALKGFADAGSDGIIQFSTGTGQVHPQYRGQIPDQRRPAHRPLPQGQAGQLRAAAAGDLA